MYKLLIGIITLALGLVSILMGVHSNNVPPYIIVVVLLFLLMMIVLLGIVKLNVRNILILYGLFLLKPIAHIAAVLPLAFILVIILTKIKNKDYSFKIPFYKSFFVLFAIGTYAIYRSFNNEFAVLFYSTTILMPIIIIPTIYNSKMTIVDIKTVVKWNFYVSAFVGLVGVILAIMNPSERLGSTWETAMTINGYYIVNFFAGLGLFFDSKEKKTKIIYAVLLLMVLLGMFFTYTRMALLALFFGFFIIAINIKKYRKYLFYIICLSPVLIPSSMTSRLQNGITEDLSMIVRFVAWINSFELIRENFFFGIGFRTFARLNKIMVPFDFLYAEHAHNLFINLLMELGIFGFLSYFTIILLPLIKYYKSFLKEKSFSDFSFFFLVAMISVVFSCLTDIFISQPVLSGFFWIYFAMMIKMHENKSTSTDKLHSSISPIDTEQ
jgi:O-antigen ligase